MQRYVLTCGRHGSMPHVKHAILIHGSTSEELHGVRFPILQIYLLLESISGFWQQPLHAPAMWAVHVVCKSDIDIDRRNPF